MLQLSLTKFSEYVAEVSTPFFKQGCPKIQHHDLPTDEISGITDMKLA
jgi:hypothetical protein